MHENRIGAIRMLRQATGCLLLEGKRDIENYITERGGTWFQAAESLIASHQRLVEADAECERIKEDRAAEALRVTAGYTIEELKTMPDQSLGLALRVADAVAALIHGTGTIAAVRAAGDTWLLHRTKYEASL